MSSDRESTLPRLPESDQDWRRAGALREGVDENYAHDVLWVMTSAEQYRLFVVERQRSMTGLGIWLEETLEAFLFPRLRRRDRL